MAEHLANRALVHVSGPEASPFLQGLVTNDMDHLMEDDKKGVLLFSASGNENYKESLDNLKKNSLALLHRSIYAMFLNTSGRVMFDVIIIHLSNESFLIDCNIESAPKLVKHLKMYRVRRKIDISIDDTSKIWSIFCKDSLSFSDINHRTMAEDFIRLGIGSDGVISTADPRIKQLGFRVIVKDHTSSSSMKLNTLVHGSINEYETLRYKLGVSECPFEVITGKSLPLDSNADYLHGVSFHKGCYIGQELTARTHHTGVVRKRIMPLSFKNGGKDLKLETGLNIENIATGKSVGKFISHIDGHGIGLMRVQECLDAKTNEQTIILSDHKDIVLTVLRPQWWPSISPVKLPDK